MSGLNIQKQSKESNCLKGTKGQIQSGLTSFSCLDLQQLSHMSRSFGAKQVSFYTLDFVKSVKDFSSDLLGWEVSRLPEYAGNAGNAGRTRDTEPLEISSSLSHTHTGGEVGPVRNR